MAFNIPTGLQQLHGKKKNKPNLRLAHANPHWVWRPRRRTCYVGTWRSALPTSSGFSCHFPSHVHPSLRWLQWGPSQGMGWLSTRRGLPIASSCCLPNSNSNTHPPPLPPGFFWGSSVPPTSTLWASPASLGSCPCPSCFQNPGAPLWCLQRPIYTWGASGEMEVSFLVSTSHSTCGVSCPSQPDLVLAPCSTGRCENTCSSRPSLESPSV